jgi:hypothetical protein
MVRQVRGCRENGDRDQVSKEQLRTWRTLHVRKVGIDAGFPVAKNCRPNRAFSAVMGTVSIQNGDDTTQIGPGRIAPRADLRIRSEQPRSCIGSTNSYSSRRR